MKTQIDEISEGIYVGDGPALSTDDLVGPALAADEVFGATALSNLTAPTIRRLAAREPRTLAVMHGSSTATRAENALIALADAYAAKLRGG